MAKSDCSCGQKLSYSECCEPIITGQKPASSPEALMRARYSAYVHNEIDFIETSMHESAREDFDKDAARAWALHSQWLGLTVHHTEGGGAKDSVGTVDFTASYVLEGKTKQHHEIAEFKKIEGAWLYMDGQSVAHQPIVREAPKVGRNDPCSCGSGKKFKKCCAA